MDDPHCSILCKEFITLHQDKLCNICFDFLSNLPTVQLGRTQLLQFPAASQEALSTFTAQPSSVTWTWRKSL